MIHFETDKKPLTFFLDQIENRDLALPDFQRSFVWDANSTRELVVSVIRSFPAGTLLLMQGGGAVFRPRPFEEAPELNSIPPYLVLDGQQRLTSLYQAFSGQGTHRYFVNLQELLDGYDIDEATEVFALKRTWRWETIEGQAADLMLPLNRFRDFSTWRDDVVEIREGDGGDDARKLRMRLNELESEYVRALDLYQFPVTTLAASTPVEAVCSIFETLNRTGVKLTVFELLTARAFARDVRLRDMWEEAFRAHPVLDDFAVDPYYVLQTISVTVSRSAKRSAVLALEIDDLVAHWDDAVNGVTEGLLMLRDECGVLIPNLMPYATMIVTMGAAWPSIVAAKGPVVGERRSKLRQWFWCSVFSQSYENAPNSRTEADVPLLMAWFEGGEPPEVVTQFHFDPTRWRDITGRQRALYRGTLALLMRQSPRDFHEGAPLSKPIIDGRSVDDHHIFPRAYLDENGRSGDIDSVLNHTLIDRTTNILIGKRAPSDYLAEIRKALGSELETILTSHGLPPNESGPLWEDDFDGFLDWRTNRLADELSDVTASPGVNSEF